MWNFLRFSRKFFVIRLSFLVMWIFFVLFSWQKEFFAQSEKSVIFLFDNSLSMAVQDIVSESAEFLSRLDSAKIFAKNLVEKNTIPVAIASFSRDMTIESPFTSDKIFLQNVISWISPRVYGGGSNIFSALENIVNLYKMRSNVEIFVFTDAEIFEEKQDFFRIPSWISLNFVGVGTLQGGLMLEGYSANGQPIYRQFSWKNAISRLDKDMIFSLANGFSADFYFLERMENVPELQEKITQKLTNNSKNINIFWLIWGIFLIIWSIFPTHIILKNEKKS